MNKNIESQKNVKNTVAGGVGESHDRIFFVLNHNRGLIGLFKKDGRNGPSGRAPNIAQNKIAKRSESEIFFAKNCEAKRSENIFRLCEAKRSEQFFKIAKNCEKLRNCEKIFNSKRVFQCILLFYSSEQIFYF